MNSLALILESAQNQAIDEPTTPRGIDMKASKLLATSILLFSVASIAMPSMAGDSGKGCAGMHHAASLGEQDGFDGRNLRHLGKTLELTDAQKETLKAQREANKGSREALQTKLVDAREALAAAVSAGANDSELNVLAETLGKLHAEQIMAGVKAQKAFVAVLTEEQKQTLAEFKAKRQERKDGRKEARESAKS